MINKKEIKNIIAVGLTLFAITAVSAFTLAIVNEITAPKIADNLEKAKVVAMQAVVNKAESFESIENLNSEIDLSIKSVDIAKDAAGEKIGYAVSVVTNGYGGEISMMVGVDSELTILGVEIVSQSETPGLGAKCTECEFKEQFAGKKGELEFSDVDAISMATITSKAVTKGVNNAVNAIKIIEEDTINE